MTRYIWEGSLWVKDPDGKPTVMVYARDFDHPELPAKKLGIKGIIPYFYARDKDGPLIDCFGGPIRKIEVTTPDEVPKLRDRYEATFEADIVFDLRTMVDRKIFYGFDEKFNPIDIPMLLPKVMWFDIEVDSPNDIMPSTETVEWPICMIQIMDSYSEEITVLTLGGRQVDECQIICDSERDLLQRFSSWIEEHDPDVVTGWYSMGFDIPYIMRRARKLGVYLSGCTRHSSKPANEERWPGRTLVDYMAYFKDWSKPIGQQPSYDLKWIATNFTKERFTYQDYGDKIRSLITNDDWETLVQYGKNDVIALKLIDKHTGIIGFYEALRRLTGVKLEDCLGRAKIVETFLMRRGIKPIPTREHKDNVSDYKGALVLQPTPGVKRDVGVTDLKAMYPGIIIAYDISPDIDHTIPKAIIDLIAERDKMRQLRLEGKADESLKTSEQSLKYIINAFYGYLAFTGARLYKPELAGFITKTGREMSLDLHEKIKAMGYSIEYGDTDSTFVSPIKSPEEGKVLEDSLNGYLLEWANKRDLKPEHAPTLKLEKIYTKLLFKFKSGEARAAKKRYVGLLAWKDGQLKNNQMDFTGLEIKRSDSSKFTKDLLREFLDLTLVKEEPDEAIRKVKEAIKNMRSGNINIPDISIPKGVHTIKESPHLRGMRRGSELLGIRFGADRKPKLLYTRGRYDSICINDDTTDEDVRKVVEVDWDKMIDVDITKKFQSYVESLGYSWDEMIHGQKGLGDFA